MKYDEFIARLREHSDIEDPAAVAEIVLEELGRRLTGREPSDLAAQLPAELKQPLTKHVGSGESFDVDDFYRRIAAREGPGVSPDYGRSHAVAVLSTLTSFVSEGELDDVRAQLPEGYRQLLG